MPTRWHRGRPDRYRMLKGFHPAEMPCCPVHPCRARDQRARPLRRHRFGLHPVRLINSGPSRLRRLNKARKASVVGKALAIAVLWASLGHAAAATLAEQAQVAISTYRQQHGLSAVKVDARLMQLASEQARAMASAGVLDHSVGRSFAARIAHYNPDTAAENIAAGTHDLSSTLAIWRRSPGHNANLLRRGVTRFGIASAPAPQTKYKVFWSLIVAAPAADRRLVRRQRRAAF
jgi:uncharacterized protein YkwD